MKKELATAILILLVLQNPFSETLYDLNEVVELALKQNAGIKRHQIELNALKRKSDKRWTALTPSLAIGANASAMGETTRPEETIEASASLSLSAGTVAALGKPVRDYESASISHSATLRETELWVRKSFLQILYEQEYIDYLKQTVETMKRQYDLTVKKQQEGLVPLLDAMAARVNYQNALLSLASTESGYRNNLSTLKQAAGIPFEKNVRLIGSLESYMPKREAAAVALKPSSFAYELLSKQLDAAHETRKNARMSVFSPTLSCTVVSKDSLHEAPAFPAAMKPVAAISIGFSISGLMPWSEANEAVQEANDAIRDIELQLMDMRTTETTKLESLIQDVHDAEKAIETRRLTVMLAEENFRLTEEAFKAGSKDIITLNNAGDALREAKVGLLKEIYGLISSAMEIENLCGMTFGSLTEKL